MDASAVIAAGQFSWLEILAGVPWHMWLWSGLLVVTAAAALYRTIRTGDEAGLALFVISGVLASMILLVGCQDARRDLIAHWRAEVAYPYISTLPEQWHKVVFFKIDPAPVSLLSYGDLYPNDANKRNLTPATLSYMAGDQLITLSGWLDVRVSPGIEAPCISMKRLSHSLGHGVNPGVYEPVVHLPEGFPLMEI